MNKSYPLCLLITLLIVSGCGLFKKKKNYSIKYPEELTLVAEQIDEEKYKDARFNLDEYLNRSENLEYFGHAYFLKGYIYELEGDTEKAIRFYRQSVKHSSRFNGLVEAKALYNLSFTYERNGQFGPLMTVLTDLVKRPQHFRPLTARVETPARMGAALASLGQMKKAKKFHQQGAEAYKRLSRSNFFSPSRNELGKAQYYLGVVVYKNDNETFDKLKQKLQWGQIHLMAASEASIGSWSRKASNQLLKSYDQMWNLIKTYKPQQKGLDKLSYRRQKHYKQLEMASDFYDIVDKVRAEEFPLHRVNRYSSKIIDAADSWQNRLKAFVVTLDIGPETIREKPVRQRPLAKVLDEEWKKKIVKVNKEQAKDETLPLPVGVDVAGDLKRYAEEKKQEDSARQQSLQKELSKKMKTGIKPTSASEKDKAFSPLPPKDPNL